MTIVRALDPIDDWTFGKGQNDYKKDVDAVAQDIKTRLKSFLNDCFFDMDSGIDWFNLLGNKNQLAIELNIRTTILNTPDVTDLVELSSVLSETRNLTVTYTATTSFGTVTDSVSV